MQDLVARLAHERDVEQGVAHHPGRAASERVAVKSGADFQLEY